MPISLAIPIPPEAYEHAMEGYFLPEASALAEMASALS